ncbi:MAG: phosphonate ABC transporter, permease protein PhnE, partial [Phenylobacterium sp.]
MTTATAPAAEIPAPPHRSLVQRAPDMLVWGLVAVLLVLALKPVEMSHFTKLFTNSQNMREFG